ncbi:uncharacterized protein N7482_002996 [Penicillium canariense]|uniref:S-adenosyl-L-methionine-dependent methyltransferase n=1 Tax=Penicillium canariense TaxID=189055 RepID=A0A9W9IIS8_9EURO|nr:uncharacterized protein N7482_002996 [Penicillium canariense]KAJ5177119.1 hypothetical protein N7482_002996 [Penicillium canariense]
MSSDAPPPFGEWFLNLLEPAQLMAMAMSYYFQVCTEAVKSGQVLAPITQTSRLRDEAFGRFWIAFSTNREEENSTATSASNEPEEAELTGSSALIPPLLKTASGIVLDIGPGTGTQMPLLRSPAITAIYGAEPCIGLHKELRAKALAEGLGSKYHVLHCGAASSELIPALEATGTGVADAHNANGGGVFDTILCVRVLCSVPEMERTTRELYSLLKPGGRLLVTEHVVNPWRTAKGSFGARVAQAIYQLLGWSFFIGDCCMDRDTEGALRRAADGDGGWESVQLERAFGWSPLPYISGVLVKRGG